MYLFFIWAHSIKIWLFTLKEERDGMIVIYISSVMAVRETYQRCEDIKKVKLLVCEHNCIFDGG